MRIRGGEKLCTPWLRQLIGHILHSGWHALISYSDSKWSLPKRSGMQIYFIKSRRHPTMWWMCLSFDCISPRLSGMQRRPFMMRRNTYNWNLSIQGGARRIFNPQTHSLSTQKTVFISWISDMAFFLFFGTVCQDFLNWMTLNTSEIKVAEHLLISHSTTGKSASTSCDILSTT